MKRVILWMVVVSMSAVAVHAQMAQTPAEKTQAQKDPTPAKEEMPAGWVMRTDQPLEKAPPRFWTMPPHYWPRAMPEGAAAFSSPEFDGEGRGRDGSYYFLVHDARARRAYVWYKSNF